MPIDETVAADVTFESPKPQPKKKDEAPDDDELVTIVVSTSEDGDRRQVNIPDRRDGGWVTFPRNEPKQIARRFLRQLGTEGPYKAVRHEKDKDRRTGEKLIIRKIWRYPYHIVD